MMELIRVRKSKLSLDMAPLVDVVFQLLIFFMLTSTFAKPSMELTLPQAVSRDLQKQEQVVININATGEMFLNEEQTSLRALKVDLEKSMKASSTAVVHIKGDKQMPYHYFVEVMDLARQAGARQVNIVHEGQP